MMPSAWEFRVFNLLATDLLRSLRSGPSAPDFGETMASRARTTISRIIPVSRSMSFEVWLPTLNGSYSDGEEDAG